MKTAYVYILASKPNGTIYVGVTSNLLKRYAEHKDKIHPDSFTGRYGIHKLVYFEKFDSLVNAIMREKYLKSWGRKRKITLIERYNPQWRDLINEVLW